jgi:hypothetical protein
MDRKVCAFRAVRELVELQNLEVRLRRCAAPGATAQIFTSWNPLTSWIRQLEGFRATA